MSRFPQGQETPQTKSRRHPCRGPALGFPFRPARALPLSRRRRGLTPAHPGKTAATPAHRFQVQSLRMYSFFGLRLRKLGAKIRRLLPNVQPVEEGVRRFQPDTEPSGDLYLFSAFLGFHFAVARDHLRAAFAEARHVQNTLDGRVVPVRTELAHQFIQPQYADLSVFPPLK